MGTGSTRLRRVVCGVAPQTSSTQFSTPFSAVGRSRRRDAVGSTRDACAPIFELNRSGLASKRTWRGSQKRCAKFTSYCKDAWVMDSDMAGVGVNVIREPETNSMRGQSPTAPHREHDGTYENCIIVHAALNEPPPAFKFIPPDTTRLSCGDFCCGVQPALHQPRGGCPLVLGSR